jgi:uncharacterized protein YjbI with pentapeptide repeats
MQLVPTIKSLFEYLSEYLDARSSVFTYRLVRIILLDLKKISILYGAVTRSWLFKIFVVIVLFICILWILLKFPVLQVAKFGIADPENLAEMENGYRATLAQILGGIAVGIGIYLAWGNLKIFREVQITESFTRAIEQLGNKKIEVRLGGIYALERISAQYQKDHWRMIEILTSFVRINSPVKDEDLTTIEEKQPKNKVSLDTQAVLTIIGRRNYSFLMGESRMINLNGLNLQEAFFNGGNLKGVHFNNSNLRSANFMFADLQESEFMSTNSSGASFVGADLKYSDFKKANLIEARFEGANLKGAKFEGANLKGAKFEGANLKGANLEGANLEGANLKLARNLSYNQLCKVQTLHNTILNKSNSRIISKHYAHLLLDVSESATETQGKG